MKHAFLSALGVLVACFGQAQTTEEPKPAGEPAATKDAAAQQEGTEKAHLQNPAADLEAKFKATLTNATMVGRWCLVKNGKLTPEQPEKYTIVGVNKLFGERWLIRARIQYGEKDITAPIPVRVKWAGDTPVITVDDVGLPGGASYSARVLVYEDTYAGTWSGGAMRGLLSGMITRETEKEKE